MFEWFGKINFTPHTRVTEFADHLKDGYLMGSKCKKCGFETYPPRANCPKCLSPDFGFNEISGQGTLLTHTLIAAAPTGFSLFECIWNSLPSRSFFPLVALTTCEPESTLPEYTRT